MPLLADPLDPALAAALRRAVLDVKAAAPRGGFAPVLHVGTPGGPASAHAVPAVGPSRSAPGTGAPLDPALRADLVAALLRRAPDAVPTTGPVTWLTRPGPLVEHDLDVQWLAAARAAHAEAGRSLTWVVVTRTGWWDPRSGLRREWRRLRDRRTGAPDRGAQ